MNPNTLDVLVVGAGQAGLALGRQLQRQDARFLLVDAGDRVGSVWRSRWDSLRLFTPAEHDGLPDLPFPAPAGTYPGKEAVADYLETYVRSFDLPVRLGTRVTRLFRDDEGFTGETTTGPVTARQGVVATGPFTAPRIPALAPRAVSATGRTVGLADDRELEVDAVVWATGFSADYGWLDVPGALPNGLPVHRRGISPVPGLAFLGLPWQHTRGSALLGFVAEDAAWLAERLAADRTVEPVTAGR